MNLSRTDLAVETAEALPTGRDMFAPGTGVTKSECLLCGCPVTRIHVHTPAGARAIGKPEGRYITIDACHVLRENDRRATPRQLSLFDAQPQTEKDARARERRVQETVLSLKARFGKNILLRATSLEDGATAMQRNAQIGGHKA